MIQFLPDITTTPRKHSLAVLGYIWVLTFILYLPAAKAGWVIDAAGWLYNIRHLGFWDYINNAQSKIPSLYQFTQFTTYIFYRLFNANPYPWHVLMVTMHAVNAWLVYTICNKILIDSGIERGSYIALTGVVFYTICPHISEVIVWEASFHYLQGFLLILVIMLQTQRFLHQPHGRYAVVAALVFVCSAFSLEVFYLTPWFVLTLGLYYRHVLNYESKVFRRLVWWFFVPQLLVFALQQVLLRMTYGAHFAHIAENVVQPLYSYFCKPIKYIFHILFFGRYFGVGVRQSVYSFCESTPVLLVFYGAFLAYCIYIARIFRTLSAKNKFAVLLLVWMVISVVILMPLSFPGILLMFYDRYTYLLDAFTYMLLALLVSQITRRYIAGVILAIYGAINLYFTIKVNLYWKHSTYIDNRLLHGLPPLGDKTVILLNIPENMYGIAMIGAQPEDEFKAMHDLLVDTNVKNKIWDAASYNMISSDDGAHVVVKNDSTINVFLNQWGTWWWYEGHGGRSYETKDYRLNLVDPGHSYELTLKHPAGQYILLYSVGPQWKVVNMQRKDIEQD